MKWAEWSSEVRESEKMKVISFIIGHKLKLQFLFMKKYVGNNGASNNNGYRPHHKILKVPIRYHHHIILYIVAISNAINLIFMSLAMVVAPEKQLQLIPLEVNSCQIIVINNPNVSFANTVMDEFACILSQVALVCNNFLSKSR